MSNLVPIDYTFANRLEMSQERGEAAEIKRILLENIPSALQVFDSHKENDKHGTDFWVECSGGHFVSVDCKVRSRDFSQFGKDDLALETWSVVEKQVIGWTRDISKRTDYVIWHWQDTGRSVIVPFQMLCSVFSIKWQEWSEVYETARQRTKEHGGYHSECVFVPRRDLWAEIYRQFGGSPVKG